MSTEIDELIDQLKNDPTVTSNKKDQQIQVTEETLHEFILEKTGRLIGHGLDSVEDLKDSIRQGINPEEIVAYSDLIKATTGALETLNKINLQKKKLKVARELKELDIESRKGLPSNKGNTTNVLIATREEIIHQIVDKIKSEPIHTDLLDENDSDSEVIDIEPEKTETQLAS